jgi:hypothetical protein
LIFIIGLPVSKRMKYFKKNPQEEEVQVTN